MTKKTDTELQKELEAYASAALDAIHKKYKTAKELREVKTIEEIKELEEINKKLDNNNLTKREIIDLECEKPKGSDYIGFLIYATINLFGEEVTKQLLKSLWIDLTDADIQQHIDFKNKHLEHTICYKNIFEVAKYILGDEYNKPNNVIITAHIKELDLQYVSATMAEKQISDIDGVIVESDAIEDEKLTQMPFPVDVLPDTLKKAINGYCKRMNGDINLVGSAMLGGISAAASHLYNVDPQAYGDGSIPITEYFFTIAEASHGKSTIFKPIIRIFNDYEKLNKGTYNKKMDEYRDYIAKLKRAKSKDKDTDDIIPVSELYLLVQ